MTLSSAGPASAAEARIGSFTAMVVDDNADDSMVRRLQEMGAGSVLRVASRSAALACAQAGGPRDLGVVTLALRDGDSLQLLRELRAAGWSRLIVLLAANDPFSVRAAFVAGAQGYLLAGTPAKTVSDRVREVLVGRPYSDFSAAARLSAREVEVLRFIAQGRSNRQVGEDMGLSALTVKSHLARIARKLGTGDRAEMVALTLRAGVIN